jgi:hypothetical protein
MLLYKIGVVNDMGTENQGPIILSTLCDILSHINRRYHNTRGIFKDLDTFPS